MSLKLLREEIAEHKQARSLIANAWENGEEATAESVASFDALSEQIEAKEAEVKKLERIELSKANDARNKTVSFSYDRGVSISDRDRDLAFMGWLASKTPGAKASGDMLAAFAKCGFDDKAECVSFDQSSTSTEGGNTLNGSLFAGIAQVLKASGNITNYTRPFTANDVTDHHFVPVDDTSNGLSLLGEKSDVSNTSVTFGSKVTLKVYDYSTAVFPISRTMIHSNFPMISYCQEMIGDRVRRGVNDLAVNGSGSNTAQGVVNLTSGRTTAAVDVISAADLYALRNSVDTVYWDNAKYFMHPSTFSYLEENLVDDTGRPLLSDFNAGLSVATSRAFRGHEIVLNSALPEMADGNKVILFGDLKSAVVTRFERGIQLAQSAELYWKSQALALMAIVSMDQRIINSSAAKLLTMKTAS